MLCYKHMARLLNLTTRQHMSALIASVALIVAALCAVFVLLRPPAADAPVVPPSDQADVAPQRVTLTGEYTCLPHRDTGGPQTMECALGMKADDGNYYGLDFNFLETGVPALATGDRFSARGLVTPVEMLSTDHWQKYQMKGIFSVTDSLVKR